MRCRNKERKIIELDSFDSLKIFLDEIELKNFEQIKYWFEKKSRECECLSKNKKLRLRERVESTTSGLFLYDMEYQCNIWDKCSGQIVISNIKIELSFSNIGIELPFSTGFEKITCKEDVFYKGIGEEEKKTNELGWQYCKNGNTNDKYTLSWCFVEGSKYYYDLKYRGQGVLTYNQYSIIFPLYDLDLKALEVHHKVYKRKGKDKVEPWAEEYDDSDLETLCHNCHIEAHKQPIKIISI